MEAEEKLENGTRNGHRVRLETKIADKLWEGREERGSRRRAYSTIPDVASNAQRKGAE